MALKAHWPGLLHKTDAGTLRLDLEGPRRIRAAYAELVRNFADVMTAQHRLERADASGGIPLGLFWDFRLRQQA
ncbi:acetate--CoA ligase family protein [Streptomyces sp. NPDC039022]|uniref:acetate--CoA ligase family protein n=1 Tax=Streptomyces sp. NPDC039022 TaxID=3157091 RepID=UPI0033CC65B0